MSPWLQSVTETCAHIWDLLSQLTEGLINSTDSNKNPFFFSCSVFCLPKLWGRFEDRSNVNVLSFFLRLNTFPVSTPTWRNSDSLCRYCKLIPHLEETVHFLFFFLKNWWFLCRLVLKTFIYILPIRCTHVGKCLTHTINNRGDFIDRCLWSNIIFLWQYIFKKHNYFCFTLIEGFNKRE